jgi:DeoR family transcriptional regulator of aga operon
MSDFRPAPARHQQILSLLSRRGRLSVTEVVRRFAVSEATARRDLDALASLGKARRVHGGVMALEQAPPELPMLDRTDEQASEKAGIGRLAAGLIGNHETVFLGSGTTVFEVARNLRGRRDLTVITNSLPVLNLLAGNREITVISLGGMLRDSELSLIGHITELGLGEVRADKAFMGARGISLEHGLMSDYLQETLTDRRILKIGRQVFIVADHTKINRMSTVLLGGLDAVHTLITDSMADAKFIRALKKRGIPVLLA